jgi:putative oxidoreductase
MLNTFPTLLTFSLLAPFLIRASLGIIFIILGYTEFKKDKYNVPKLSYTISILEIIGGLVLLVGFLTQIVSIVLSIIIFSIIVIKFRNKSYNSNEVTLYVFMFISLISLLLSGAGAFAIDLPL